MNQPGGTASVTVYYADWLPMPRKHVATFRARVDRRLLSDVAFGFPR
jgi:hypothetical protein